MADIAIKTANIFDYTKQNSADGYVDNAFIKQSGETTNENIYAVSEYIEVTGDYISLSVPTSLYSPSICFYNAEKQYISGKMYNSRTTVTEQIPQNAMYIRFTIVKQYANTIMVNLGDTLQPFAPYWQHSLKKYNGAEWQNATVHEF